jgi:RNA polymerase sigma-70 factor (ECF subfamily)
MPLIEEAERELVAAARHARPGRFQIEAAIQSVHAERAHGGRTDWGAIARFYDLLVEVAPSLGATVGQAAAHAESESAKAGLALLDAIDDDVIAAYQPYWAVRAHLLSELHRTHDARDAYSRAIGLSEDDAVRKFLLERSSRTK